MGRWASTIMYFILVFYVFMAGKSEITLWTLHQNCHCFVSFCTVVLQNTMGRKFTFVMVKLNEPLRVQKVDGIISCDVLQLQRYKSLGSCQPFFDQSAFDPLLERVARLAPHACKKFFRPSFVFNNSGDTTWVPNQWAKGLPLQTFGLRFVSAKYLQSF